jgi:hypothetical protein
MPAIFLAQLDYVARDLVEVNLVGRVIADRLG